MSATDLRADHLAWVETHVRAKHHDLEFLRLSSQSHYSSAGFAFIVIYGVDKDTPRRRAIRAEASELLRKLGYYVELEPGRDVYDIDPCRPISRHEMLAMLASLAKKIGRNDPSNPD